MTGIINQETGLIDAIGPSYPTQLPDEITFGNYNKWKCIDLQNPSVIESYEPYTSPEDRMLILQADKEKGQFIIDTYLDDNRQLGLTTSQSFAQLAKFRDIADMLKYGALGPAKVALYLVEVDTLFTQERKTKYLNMFP